MEKGNRPPYSSPKRRGNRIQCIEDRIRLCLYRCICPVRVSQTIVNNSEHFTDCLDQLNGMFQKYSPAHTITIGGDWIMDLYTSVKKHRQQSLKEFMQENDLTTKQTQKTYINPHGMETSTLDYICYPQTFNDNIGEMEVLENMKINVSDHLPVAC